jgi:hypothetical protein
MLIANRTYAFSRDEVAAVGGVAESVADAAAGEPLRWFVSEATRCPCGSW